MVGSVSLALNIMMAMALTLIRYKGEKWIHSSVIGVQWINDGLLDYRLRTTPSKKGKVIYKGSRHHYVSGGEIKNVLDIKSNWVKVRHS